MTRRKQSERTEPPAPTVTQPADTPSTRQPTSATFSTPRPSTRSAPNTCPRCEGGLILGRGENASCIACGYEPITPSEYASAEAYIAAVNSGDVSTRARGK